MHIHTLLSPWMAVSMAVLLAAGGTAFASSGCDPLAGEKIYAKCSACHALEPGVQMMGPSLHGVLGRRAGSEPGFNYSAAMAQSDLVWNARNLDTFLASPGDMLPGNTMPFSGLKSPRQRQDLICLFQQHRD